MKTLGAALRALSPYSMLRIYMTVVVLTAVVAIGIVLTMSSLIDQRSLDATQDADAALATSQIQSELRAPLTILFVNTFAFINSEELAGLSPETRAALIEETLNDVDSPRPFQSVPLPDTLSVPMSERNAFALQTQVARISQEIDALAAVSTPVDLSAVLSERARLDSALAEYLDTKSATSYRELFGGALALGARLSDAGDAYAYNLNQTHTSLNEATRFSRLSIMGALIALAVTMAVATYYVSRLIQRAFNSSETERRELRETTATLKYRNDQLNALYNVFAEITDTLSMRYVITATLRETLRVMNASMVTLRLLRDGQLVAAGNLTSEGKEIRDLPPVPLGEGPSGRVARRGRSMRIDSDAQAMLGPSTDPSDPNSGVESGIIVPLIVGARVVGTLACWSRNREAFGEADERILEMMASQVATAVIAADATEMSERRAAQDPLTGLPNRRQLNDDLAGDLEKWAADGRKAVVAMVDIDHFKRLNDDFGHRVGDVTLQKVASVMRLSIRDTDRIYRYGGEEFVVIFADASRSEAVLLAERLLKAVAETPLSGDQLEPVGPVTISAGLALLPDNGADFNQLIERADRAMYRAKEAGRNRICVWDQDMEPAAAAA